MASRLSALGDREPAWWVFFTGKRQEGALAADLLATSFPFYLPLMPWTACCGRYKTNRCLRSFLGHVFVSTEGDERVQLLTTNRVFACLFMPQSEELRATCCD
jgi:hypothetical protein